MPDKSAKKYYYHISSFQGWLTIKKQGLKCSADGYVYMLNDDKIAGYVAENQLGMSDFSLFRIDPEGIKGKIEPDLVGELTVKYQFRVKQKLIEKKYLKDLGMFHATPTPFDEILRPFKEK